MRQGGLEAAPCGFWGPQMQWGNSSWFPISYEALPNTGNEDGTQTGPGIRTTVVLMHQLGSNTERPRRKGDPLKHPPHPSQNQKCRVSAVSHDQDSASLSGAAGPRLVGWGRPLHVSAEQSTGDEPSACKGPSLPADLSYRG